MSRTYEALEMKLLVKRLGLLILGWAFVLVGIAGLFLPILQGILFIVIGLLILSSEYVWAHRLVEKLKIRFPGVAQASAAASEKARLWIQRLGRTSPSSRDDSGKSK